MIKKMDLKNKLQQDFVIDNIKDRFIKQKITYPLIVELDPTTACNLACPGCISEDILNTKNSFSSQRLMELGKELKEAGVKGVILIGGGEPLSHPAIGDLIEYLGKNNIKIGITTNGVFIDKYLNLIAKYASWTRVSIDASNQEMFNLLRPSKDNKSKFDKVIDNIKQLSKIKKGKVGFSFLIRSINEIGVNQSNIEQIYEAGVLAKNIGCDYFEIKPSYNYKNNSIHTLVKYSDEEIESIKIQISKLNALIDDSFSVIKAIVLDDAIKGIQKKQKKEYNFCPVATLRTLITPLGVYICPYWRGKTNFKLGDVKEESFLDFWKSNRTQKKIFSINPSIVCNSINCLRHDSNLEILNLIDRLKSQNIKTVDEFDVFI